MLTIIGDVHGKYDKYRDIVNNSEYSICLGDFGFTKEWNKLNYSGLDSNKHKICKGNHDQYEFESPFDLGDFGEITLDNKNIFFIRGGISIDRVYRIGEELSGSPKTYWSQEELNFTQMLECIELYKKIKPDLVISHAPPACIIDDIHGNKHSILQRYKFHIGFQENTSLLGNELLKIHAPKQWFFGHHHVSYSNVINGTIFTCLPELHTYDLS